LITLIRSRQHIRWNSQTDLLGSLQVDSQLEFVGCFNRQIGWLRVKPDIAINLDLKVLGRQWI
jgi:hypothetical protein